LATDCPNNNKKKNKANLTSLDHFFDKTPIRKNERKKFISSFVTDCPEMAGFIWKKILFKLKNLFTLVI
jgi:hypothetical protein